MAATPALTLAVLADLHPHRDRPHFHGILAWTATGQRHYLPLPPAGSPPAAPDADHDQLAALTQAIAKPPTSCGLTWQTWVLPTIPPALHHLPPHTAVRTLAGLLARLRP
jgi:hypothetical protein